jgi:hypothetical protein
VKSIRTVLQAGLTVSQPKYGLQLGTGKSARKQEILSAENAQDSI